MPIRQAIIARTYVLELIPVKSRPAPVRIRQNVIVTPIPAAPMSVAFLPLRQRKTLKYFPGLVGHYKPSVIGKSQYGTISESNFALRSGGQNLRYRKETDQRRNPQMGRPMDR